MCTFRRCAFLEVLCIERQRTRFVTGSSCRAPAWLEKILRGVIVAPVDEQGTMTLSHFCPHCWVFPLEDYFWWVSLGRRDNSKKTKKQCNW